jgi:hypothetical protein
VLVLDMIEILPPMGKYKYDTWIIFPMKCYIDNSMCLWSCIRIVNSHIIMKGGISMDPRKAQDVLGWNLPTSVGDIQSFLRLAGYYQRFSEGFSKITKPMTELLKKDKKFKSTPSCEACF